MEGSFSPRTFIESILALASSNDILAIGAYNPCLDVYTWLSNFETTVNVPSPKPYNHSSFDLNRREFPKGRAFDLPINKQVIDTLKIFSEMPQGGLDKALFFDHVLIYRLGHPILPLLNFHDAFSGGELYLSGHYDRLEIESFAKSLNAIPIREIRNDQ